MRGAVVMVVSLLLAMPAPACVGDCQGDGVVSVGDLVRGVGIALAVETLGVCPAIDPDGDGAVHISELVQALTAGLDGCPPPPTATATPTVTDTPTSTATPTSSATATASPLPIATATAGATPTSTNSATPTDTATVSPTPTATTRPNFVIINLDDTRHDGFDRMPVLLERIAGDGVRFSQSFVADPLCAPSRASLLTGLLARHHGTRALGGLIGGAASFRTGGGDRQTLAVWLRDAGYATGLFGKYLNGYATSEAEQGPGGTYYVPPGWERWQALAPEFYGGVNGGTYRLVDEHGAAQLYDDHTTDAQYAPDVLGAGLRAFAADAVEAGRPFFAVYTPPSSHNDVVLPAPAERHEGLFAFLPPWRPPSWNEADVSDKPRWIPLQPADPFGGDLTDAMRIAAYESLLAVDEQLAALLDQLAMLGVDRDTVVLVTSDNGVLWGEHRAFLQSKELPYEEAIRVPMLVRYPALGARGTVSGEAVQNIDIAPTVMALAGLTPPIALDGRSFAAQLTAAPPPPTTRLLPLEGWSGNRNDFLDCTGQPSDGDRLRVFSGPASSRPRSSLTFEFDLGDGAADGVAVPLGATVEQTLEALATEIRARIPLLAAVRAGRRLALRDQTPERHGVLAVVTRDLGAVMTTRSVIPDFVGLRDVANGWTYVEYDGDEAELYDLGADPWQLDNRATDPAYADLRAALAAQLRELVPD